MFCFNQCRQLDGFISDQLISVGEGAFSGCSSMRNFKICDSLTIIGKNAFSENRILEGNIINKLQDSYLTSVGDNAFFNCEMLTGNFTGTIKNKNNAEIVLGAGVFSGTRVKRATVFAIDGDTITKNQFAGVTTFVDENGVEITNLTIPSNVTKIMDNAFSGCTSLTSVNIPESLTSIGTGVFSGCINLINVVFSGNSKLDIFPGSTFENCSSLRDINMPSSVKILGTNAFMGCSSLKEIDLQNIEFIYSSVFRGCSSLSDVTFSQNLRMLNDSSFNGCIALTGKIEIPESVTTLSTSVFWRAGISEIDIKCDLQSLPDNIFYYAPNLKKVTFSGSSPNSIGKNAFIGCNNLNKIVGLTWENLDNIGISAFDGCSNLKCDIVLKSDCVYDVDTSFRNSGINVTRK